MMERPRLRVAVVARAVAPVHGVGGLERSVRDLVRHLALRHVGVTLITPPAPRVAAPASVDPFASPFIEMQPVSYLTFPLANRRGTTVLDRSTSYLLFGERAGRAAAALAAAGAIDIVHGFGAAVLGYARRRARLKPPLVFNPQGLEEFGATLDAQPLLKRVGYTPLRWAVRRCARAADCVIATDVALEATVERHLRPAPGVMLTIPNGIDLPAVTALAGPAEGAILRRRHGIGADEIVLLSAGRVEYNKGFDVLVAALAGLAAEGGPLASKTWRWVIVGSGPYRQTIARHVERAGLSRHVIFAGRTPDPELHAWYEAASLFVHPTRYEGSSLVTLEAMAHGKPVVATKAGGLPDKVRPGENGWLVEPGDAGPLAEGLASALAAQARWSQLGAASRSIVARDFAWATLIDRQIAVYEELLEKARTDEAPGESPDH